MDKRICCALTCGFERLSAWADLLDEINVFPVADADTGRNLVVTLGPFHQAVDHGEHIIEQLLFSACGNSGNIAARFFSGFLSLKLPENLPHATKLGRNYAWQSIGNPKSGTMLTVFDGLANLFNADSQLRLDQHNISGAMDRLAELVESTSEMIPELKEAEVVDSGALGMFIFLEGFFHCLFDNVFPLIPVTQRFGSRLRLSGHIENSATPGYCVDMLVQPEISSSKMANEISGYGESLVIGENKDLMKIHVHTSDKEALRKKMNFLGKIIKWADEDMGYQAGNFSGVDIKSHIHIMTDAAGSLTRQDARRLRVTLLDSYVLTDSFCAPETLTDALKIYEKMKEGQRVTTSQASVFERHQHYQSVLGRYDKVLYLCTGSVYTGNYHVAIKWKKDHDPDNRFIVVDTGAASGRLAAMVLDTVKYANNSRDPSAVFDYARTAFDRSKEYIFLDKLEYLAAGGRLSKSKAFFGDLLGFKPIITPLAQGAKKVGTARDSKAQVRFVLDTLSRVQKEKTILFILLEYSDNRKWIENHVKEKIQHRCPSVEIILQPLSLTSGIHMGPGTWAVAFATEKTK